MIDEIAIRNFKSIRNIKLKPKLITILMGPNGAGKSNVLKALAFLAQQKDDIRFTGDFVDLLSFNDTVFKKNTIFLFKSLMKNLPPGFNTLEISFSSPEPS